MPSSVAVDYSVVDHLYRVQAGTYNGPNASALEHFRQAAEDGRAEVWIAEITPVEMLHGREKVAAESVKLARASAKDDQKNDICTAMRARYLAYPCSKVDDTYSRLGMSFRTAGPNSEDANRLEQKLLGIKGVSAGDARQLVSCAFPTNAATVGLSVTLDWFVAEDAELVEAVVRAVAAGALPELAHLSFGSTAALVVAHPEWLWGVGGRPIRRLPRKK